MQPVSSVFICLLFTEGKLFFHLKILNGQKLSIQIDGVVCVPYVQMMCLCAWSVMLSTRKSVVVEELAFLSGETA